MSSNKSVLFLDIMCLSFCNLETKTKARAIQYRIICRQHIQRKRRTIK